MRLDGGSTEELRTFGWFTNVYVSDLQPENKPSGLDSNRKGLCKFIHKEACDMLKFRYREKFKALANLKIKSYINNAKFFPESMVIEAINLKQVE